MAIVVSEETLTPSGLTRLIMYRASRPLTVMSEAVRIGKREFTPTPALACNECSGVNQRTMLCLKTS